MTRLEKLLMRVEMIDKITGPANKIMGTMDKLTKNTAMGFANITGGVAGMWGVGVAMQSITGDAREFHRAIGEVSSLSVAEDAMAALTKAGLNFSIRYGESAADFVRSSYDIQSAIAGLVGNELATFTEASNVLAKGTKADAATITNYMGTMYGIFKGQADSMGKAQWVQMLTGQTAQAVEMFKTNGVQMSGAFTALGADATAHGVAINEQMAVLGKLQATMSGSEAGTKYKAFLRGVGAAQDQLGMKFTDSAGRMLPVDQILSKLQGKFGAIDTVAKSDMLKKAFGSDEAVAAIKLLIADTNGLSDSITTLGNVRGMDKARAMAEKMVDPLDRVYAASTAVKIGFGSLIEKAMFPFYETVIENMSVLSGWIDKYPHLFGALAKLTIYIAGVVAIVSALAIAKGMVMIATVGFTTALTILKAPLALVRGGIWLWNAALTASRILLLTTALRFPALITGLIAMKAGFISGAAGAWAFAAALLATPITWIVIGVVALIAGLVLLVKNWDAVKVAAVGAMNWMFEKWQAFRAIIEDNPVLKFIFQPLLLAADFVGLLITNLDKIPQWFSSFKNWLSDLNVFDVLMAPAKLALETLNLLPGVNIDTSNLQNIGATQTVAEKVPAIPAENIAPKVPVPAAMQMAQPAPATIPAVMQMEQPAPATVPAVMQMAQPAPVTVPAVMQVAQPAPVTVPAVMQIAEPANMPVFTVPLAAVPTPTAAERLDSNIEREREKLAPAPVAPVRNVPQGGLMQQINNTRNNSNAQHIGTVNIQTQQISNAKNLRDELMMGVG
jgi:hypothetical protein